MGFGSVARGDDRPDPDLDLLIELEPRASVVDILGLDEDLAVLLGCPVDVLTTTELEFNELLRRGVNAIAAHSEADEAGEAVP